MGTVASIEHHKIINTVFNVQRTKPWKNEHQVDRTRLSHQVLILLIVWNLSNKCSHARKQLLWSVCIYAHLFSLFSLDALIFSQGQLRHVYMWEWISYFLFYRSCIHSRVLLLSTSPSEVNVFLVSVVLPVVTKVSCSSILKTYCNTYAPQAAIPIPKLYYNALV